jgi:hypothetical protein
VDKNTILALVLIAGLGIGGYFYFKGKGGVAQAAESPLPQRVQQKRAVGTAIANTSANSMRPELPPEVQGVLDSAGATYKRGSDLYTQGKDIGQAARQGDYGAALTGAGALFSSFSSAGPTEGVRAAPKPKAVSPTVPKAQPVSTFKPAAPINPYQGLAPTQQVMREIAAAPQARSGHNRF